MFFPRNDSYHLVHHLFPGVPVSHFHFCHERLMEDRNYPESHCRTGRLIKGKPSTDGFSDRNLSS